MSADLRACAWAAPQHVPAGCVLLWSWCPPRAQVARPFRSRISLQLLATAFVRGHFLGLLRCESEQADSLCFLSVVGIVGVVLPLLLRCSVCRLPCSLCVGNNTARSAQACPSRWCSAAVLLTPVQLQHFPLIVILLESEGRILPILCVLIWNSVLWPTCLVLCKATSLFWSRP